MGTCTTRDNPEDIAKHNKSHNHRNDKEFIQTYEIPELSGLVEHAKASSPNSSNVLQLLLEEQRRLKAEIIITNKRLQALPPNQEPVLMVEVQKGTNISPAELSLQSHYPIVRVRMVPSDETQETFEGYPNIPYWYSLLRFTVPAELFRQVEMQVVLNRKFGKPKFFGGFTIPFEDLRGQRVVDQWFEVNTKVEQVDKPQIKVRLQYLSDQKLLLEACKEKLMALQKEIDRGINACKSV